ncbi:MAG: phage head-tail adapter protein [Pisciglobus halotolerans]|nr:phage head-tail adapter protein [Pisciglobus halotolerans]
MKKPEFKYTPPKVQSGDLRTPAKFYEYTTSTGPEPDQVEKSLLHECFSEVYNPSMKDLEKLKTANTKHAVTINIRDSKGEYVPTNKHFVELLDYRYKDIVWDVLDVRYDIQDNSFITILLGVTE